MECNGLGNCFRLIIIALTFLALTMQIFTSISCSVVELKNSDVTMGIFFRGIGDECDAEPYETDDPFIESSRRMLVLSTVAGSIAGFLVLFEWCLCEVCCAGCLEGLAYFLAWTMSGFTFLFYGAPVCTKTSYQDIIDEYNLQEAYDTFLKEGGNDFLEPNHEPYEGCEPSDASHLMTVAVLCYLACGILICCTPQPEPFWQQK